MRRLNDPELVREEYADERGLARAEWPSSPPPLGPIRTTSRSPPSPSARRAGARGRLRPGRARRADGERARRARSSRSTSRSGWSSSRAARGVEAIVGDVQDLPFADGSFDCVVAAWMLYHAADLDLALREVRRVLRDWTAGSSRGRAASGTSPSSGSSSARSARSRATSAPRTGKPRCGAISAPWNGETSVARSRSPTTRPRATSSRRRPTRAELAARLPRFDEPLDLPPPRRRLRLHAVIRPAELIERKRRGRGARRRRAGRARPRLRARRRCPTTRCRRS